VLEYVSISLGIIAAIAGTLAWVYRRGHSDGLDSADEQSIKKDISGLDTKIEEVKTEQVSLRKHDDKVHGEIFTNIQRIDSKIDKLQGSSEVIQKLFRDHIAKS
jgi:hypothetical protein